MIDKNELKAEVNYLKSVLYTLEKEIEKNNKKVADINDDLQDEMRYAWDPTNLLSDTEFTYAIADIHRRSYSRNTSQSKLKSYKRMIKNAYFARFDFDDGTEVMNIYMGIATLQSGDYFYVYDWRAPICSMFYDYELGEASYVTPNGETVSGKITLKRQFKIEGDKIKEVFDTDMQIIDDILCRMLQENANDKMRNIVNTIQKDQNKVIRKNDVDILVVNGPAGSGKTSVAMHKIAYLLYSNKNKINNSNILILSPNEIFSNYISGVLPQIGEDNVYQTTFMDYIRTFLTDYKVTGSLADIYEKVYAGTEDIWYNSIKLKFGAIYINLIENYLKTLRADLLGLKDIVLDGKVIIKQDYLTKLAGDLEDSGISFAEQYKKLCEKIILHASIKTQKSQSNNAKLRKLLQVDRIKPKELYNQLYSDRDRFVGMIEDIYNTTGAPKASRFTIKQLDEIFAYTKASLAKGVMPYEDVCGYLYFKDRLLGSVSQNQIKYVIIDEAQDYSLMQYKILAEIFKSANITILGDINQCIMPFSAYNNYDSVLNVLRQNRDKVRSETCYLSKTYRSTTQINAFVKKIITDGPLYNQVNRNGDEVEVIANSGKNYRADLISQAVELKKKYNTVAIITKNQAEADEFKGIIAEQKKPLAKVLNKKDKAFMADKVMIIPSYLAKGLEFDAVLVADASSKKYTDAERNLFYVVCTRALHKLSIYYCGEPSQLIPAEYLPKPAPSVKAKNK